MDTTTNPIAAFLNWLAQIQDEGVRMDITTMLLLTVPGCGVRSRDFAKRDPQDWMTEWAAGHTSDGADRRRVVGAALALRAVVDFWFTSQRDTPSRWAALARYTDGFIDQKSSLESPPWLDAFQGWTALLKREFSDEYLDGWCSA